MAIARWVLPVPVPPTRTTLRCWARKAPIDTQAAARAQAGERYDAFVAALGRRLAKGLKVREEISEDVAGVSGAE